MQLLQPLTIEGWINSPRRFLSPLWQDGVYPRSRACYESDRDLARAVSGLRLATQQDPTNVSAHYYLGQALRALVKQEILTEAEKAFHVYLKAGAPLGQQKKLQEFLKSRRAAKTS